MNFGDTDQSAIKQYLLGTLNPESSQEIEQGILTDDELYENLEATEDDLIDEYLNGSLTEDENARFREYFLVTPERHQSLRFARTLRHCILQAPALAETATPSFVARFWTGTTMASRAAAFALLLLIAGGVLVYSDRISGPPTSFAVTFDVSGSNNRAEGPQLNRIKIPAGTDVLKVSLILPAGWNADTRYRAELEKRNGEKKSLEIVSRAAQSVVVEIPAAETPRGEYALKLFSINADGGEQRVGNYFFTVD